MAKIWLSYVGGFITAIGGFSIGFGAGLYFMYQQIAKAIAGIGGEITRAIPLIGPILARTVENWLYN